MVSINYDNSEILITGTREDYYSFCDMLVYDNRLSTKTGDYRDKFYKMPINSFEIKSVDNSNKLITLEIENDKLIISGDDEAFFKLRRYIFSIGENLGTEKGAHVDMFYYESNDFLNETDFFITFEVDEND